LIVFLSGTKMIVMKRIFVAAVSIALVWLVSCSSPESKLVGIWKVKNVEANFDEQKVSPEMLNQVIEMQKQTYFRILNDSVMIIISNDNSHEAKWKFNQEDNSVIFFFEGMETSPTKLGVYLDQEIVSETNTPLGKLTVFYGKE